VGCVVLPGTMMWWRGSAQTLLVVWGVALQHTALLWLGASWLTDLIAAGCSCTALPW